MTEKSYFWPSDLIGDGQLVTQEDWPAVWGALFDFFNVGAVVGGPFSDQRGQEYRLDVFFSGYNGDIYPGQALIGGQFYSNDALRSFFAWPQFGDTAFHSVKLQLQADWATRQVRPVAENGSDGGSIGGKANYELGEATYRFGPGDPYPFGFSFSERQPEFASCNSQVLLRRQGGSATDWTTQGTTNYQLEQQCVIWSSAVQAAAAGTSGTISLNLTLHPKNSALAVTILSSNALATLSFYLTWNAGANAWQIVWANSSSDQPQFMVLSFTEKTL